MKHMTILTGGTGHLGRNIAQLLAKGGAPVRALVLPGEDASPLLAAGFEVVYGSVCEPASLRPLFAGAFRGGADVIHAAAVIDISSKPSARARQVNVGGTRNMVELALSHGVRRFVHISSVHAIPEPPGRRRISEIKRFFPERVFGCYAKTKAEASCLVMDAVETRGLPGIILHPSGMAGPPDTGTNNIVAAIRDYMRGKIPACPRGGYDVVDVRDVAAAVLAALERGEVGEAYILSGRHCEFGELFSIVREISGMGPKLCPRVPMWMAKLAAPVLERQAKRQNRLPLVTPYSLATLSGNDNFSHEKATRALDFWPRDIYDTVEDTVQWLNSHSPPKKTKAKRRRAAAKA